MSDNDFNSNSCQTVKFFSMRPSSFSDPVNRQKHDQLPNTISKSNHGQGEEQCKSSNVNQSGASKHFEESLHGEKAKESGEGGKKENCASSGGLDVSNCANDAALNPKLSALNRDQNENGKLIIGCHR